MITFVKSHIFTIIGIIVVFCNSKYLEMKKILILLLAINASVFSQEIISTNPSFEDGLSAWQFGVASYDEDTPDAEFEVVGEGYKDESACKVKIRISTQSDNLNDAYLMYRGLKMKKGKKYRISFRIKSNTRDDKVLVSFGSGTPPDIQIMESRTMKFVGDNSWKDISYTFQVKKDQTNVDFKDLSLFVGFNHRFGTFYVDDFSFKSF